MQADALVLGTQAFSANELATLVMQRAHAGHSMAQAFGRGREGRLCQVLVPARVWGGNMLSRQLVLVHCPTLVVVPPKFGRS